MGRKREGRSRVDSGHASLGKQTFDCRHSKGEWAEESLSIGPLVKTRDWMPSPAQIRAARALLNWSQHELADRSGVGRRTVAEFEGGGAKVKEASVKGMMDALTMAGIQFSGEGEPEGVTRRTV